MSTRIVELKDGLRIEAEVTESEVATLVDGKVDQTIDAIKPMLLRVMQPLESAWNELNKKLFIEKAEVEISFGMEASGSFFVASTKGTANLKVKLLIGRNASGS